MSSAALIRAASQAAQVSLITPTITRRHAPGPRTHVGEVSQDKSINFHPASTPFEAIDFLASGEELVEIR